MTIKLIPFFVLMLAGVAMGQTTRPSGAVITIAQLKEENAKLKAEVRELQSRLEKYEPNLPAQAVVDFTSPIALAKWLPGKALRRGDETQLQWEEKRRWVSENVCMKKITVRGKLVDSEVDEIGQITVTVKQIEQSGSLPPLLSFIKANFAGTNGERKVIAATEVGGDISITGMIFDLVATNGYVQISGESKPGIHLDLQLEQCHLSMPAK